MTWRTLRSLERRFDDGQVYEELPARIRHGNRFRPERVWLRDNPEVEWWIEEILSDQQGGGSESDPIHRRYRLRVTGPMPGRFSERGEWVMVATGYLYRTSWWIRPEDEAGQDAMVSLRSD